MFSHRSERRRSTTSSTNCNDAVLAAFIDTVINIENHSLPNFEGALHPSITHGDPDNTKMEQDDDIGNCILLQRVYFSEEEDRMKQEIPLSEKGSTSLEGEQIYSRTASGTSCKQKGPCLWENEETSIHSVHCVTPGAPFVCPSNYNQTSTDTFLREKNLSMEYNSEGQANYTEPNETEKACDLEKNNLVNGSGDVTWRNDFTAYEQVTGGNGTPPFCLPRRRTYHPKICSHPLSDHCLPNTTTNPCSYQSQVQNRSWQTVEEMSSEAWNKNINKANAKPLTETWPSVRYEQGEKRIRSHSVYDSSGPMQTVSPKPVPRFQVEPSNANFVEDQRLTKIFPRASSDYGIVGPKYQKSEYHSQKMVAAEPKPEGWHAHWQEFREPDKNLKSLRPFCERPMDETGCQWPLKVYNGHQAYAENQFSAEEAFSLENGQNVSYGVRRVLPRSKVGFAKEPYNCGTTITGTDDSSTPLIELQHYQASSQINSSHPLTDEESLARETLWQGESLAVVPDSSPKNCPVSQHGSSDLEERPSSNRLTKDEKANKAGILTRRGKGSSSEENRNSNIEKRSSKKQEDNTNLHSSQGSVQRNAIPTPPNAGLPAQETKEELTTSRCTTTSSSQKAYKCDFPGCSKEYHRGSHLICHQRLHTGERPYRCPWKNCAMTFRRSDERLRHFRVHTRARPYQCPLCSQRFFRSDHRKTHLRSKHNTNTIPS